MWSFGLLFVFECFLSELTGWYLQLCGLPAVFNLVWNKDIQYHENGVLRVSNCGLSYMYAHQHTHAKPFGWVMICGHTCLRSMTHWVFSDGDPTIFLTIAPGLAGCLVFIGAKSFLFWKDGWVYTHEGMEVYRRKAVISEDLNITKLSYPKGRIYLFTQNFISKLDHLKSFF